MQAVPYPKIGIMVGLKSRIKIMQIRNCIADLHDYCYNIFKWIENNGDVP
jgi:hypothetical protein